MKMLRTQNHPLADPHVAVARLQDAVQPVGIECVEIQQAVGRVLAESIVTDRPSPSCDVSAMDGYAVRAADLSRTSLSISGEIQPGQAPMTLEPSTAIRIFTGAAVPSGADLVIRREDVQELPDTIILPRTLTITPGANIRRCGENAPAGQIAVTAGQPLTAAHIATAASCGYRQVRVHRRLRVALLSTGNELMSDTETIVPWRIRDTNGPALAAMLQAAAWMTVQPLRNVTDELPAMMEHVRGALQNADALITTGAVSMGDYDQMPDAITRAGGRIIFHGTKLRPGKPLLGAIGSAGQPILALPGNPVAAMVTLRRFGISILRRRAGYRTPEARRRLVRWSDDNARLRLWWYRLAAWSDVDRVTTIETRGSGDWVSLAESDGVIELPPEDCASQTPVGFAHFYPWQETW